MSQSHFFLIVGRGHHYTGDGLNPFRIFAFFDRRDVWVSWGLERRDFHRFISDRRFCIDDVMVMIGLLELPESEVFPKDEIRSYLDIEGEERRRSPERGRRGMRRPLRLTIRPRSDLTQEKLQELYDRTKKLISTFCDLKVVAVLLDSVNISFCSGDGSFCTHIYTGKRRIDEKEADRRDTLVEGLERRFKEYGLRNYEICRAARGEFFGAFTAMREREDKDEGDQS